MTSKRWTRWTCTLVLTAACVAPGCVTKPQCQIDPAQAFIDAKTVLRQAVEDPADAVTRRAAIQAISEVLPEDCGGVLKQALEDPDEGVRFAAAMALGDIRYAPALPALQDKAKMYTGERDKRTYCAVLYALFRLGDTSRLGELADYLFDREADVRAFAAQVMGKVGNPAAVGLLKNALVDEKDKKAQYNITEAMAVLGDAGAQARLESFAHGPFVDLQLEAIPALAREYSRETMAILQDLMTEQPRNLPQIRVRAAGAMARLGQPSTEGYDLCAKAASNPGKFVVEQVTSDRIAAGFEVPRLQQLAAISLGWMHRTEALCVLNPLLQSPEGGVRVAASMSMLRLTGSQKAPPPAMRRDEGAPVVEAPSGRVEKRPEPAPPSGVSSAPAPSTQPDETPQPSDATTRPAGLQPPPLRTSGAKD